MTQRGQIEKSKKSGMRPNGLFEADTQLRCDACRSTVNVEGLLFNNLKVIFG